MQVRCPPIDPALIAYLDAAFPDVAANPDVTCPRIAYGQASVIRHLKSVAEAQEEEFFDVCT